MNGPPVTGSAAPLHWSLAHDLPGQPPQVRAALAEALASWPAGGRVDRALRRYDVLPNYPAGRRPPALEPAAPSQPGAAPQPGVAASAVGAPGTVAAPPQPGGALTGAAPRAAAAPQPGDALQIGVAEISRSEAADGGARYRVSHGNATSGEQVTLQFHTTADPLPRLTGAWTVTAANEAGDRYRGVRLTGAESVNAGGRRVITLTVNGVSMRTAGLDAALPMTCWWALFDGLPAIARGAAPGAPFALLEDLEKLRAPCTVRPLAGAGRALEVAGHRLRGYCQYGAGMLPSYWWLDAAGTVAIVSSVYHTLVLRAGGEDVGGGKPPARTPEPSAAHDQQAAQA